MDDESDVVHEENSEDAGSDGWDSHFDSDNSGSDSSGGSSDGGSSAGW